MTTVRRNWIDAFYWIGVTMTLACFAFVMAGNTEFAGRFEHRGFPLSWALGTGAILAFLAAEVCHGAFASSAEAKDRISTLPSELEAVESQS